MHNDYKKIPDIIYNADEVVYSGKNNKGLDTFRYKKTMDDGTVYYAEEVRQAIKNDMPQYRVLHNNELTEQAVKEVEADFNSELSRLSTSKDFDALVFEKQRVLKNIKVKKHKTYPKMKLMSF